MSEEAHPYPEHEKLRAIDKSGERALIQRFLDWLDEQPEEHQGQTWLLGYYPADHDELIPVREPKDKIMAAFFGIDQQKLEEEKLAMLAVCRKAHGG